MAVKRVFRYLQGTVYLALEYCGCDIKMNAFEDSDYAGDTNSRISTSGMAIFSRVIANSMALKEAECCIAIHR
jgi:hypothetical protein